MALWFETAYLPMGWVDRVRVHLGGGRIVRVDVDADPAPEDARFFAAMPGMANLHSHAFQRAMAGLTEVRGQAGDDFWSWRTRMYQFVGQMDPDQCEAIAALAFMEMLETGFTRVGEFHYLHHQPDGTPYADRAELGGRIMAAADAVGIGLTLLPVFYAQGGFGATPAGAAQARFLNSVDGFENLVTQLRGLARGDTRVGIAPHSLRAVGAADLGAILPLAGDGPVHIHIAEQQREVDDCIAATGQRPVRWLLDHVAVDPRWTLVHATHNDAGELADIVACGAVAGLCPVTEANLGDGLFPAVAFLQAGGVFGVGSDSNVRIDLAEELRLLEYGQRLQHHGRNQLAGDTRASTGARLFDGACIGGAQSLAHASGIAVGNSADLIALNRDDPSFAERRGDALIDSFIFAARRPIDRVWRNGVEQVRDGRHIARPAIERRYRATLAKLLA